MAKGRSGISQKQLREILDKPWYSDNPRGKESKASIQGALAQRSDPFKERDRRSALDRKTESKAGMVNIDGPLHCRIIRLIGKRGRVYDDDNISGGAKSLRDCIATAHGLKGDSEADGITFEYEQRQAPDGIAATEIEIYQIIED